MSCMYGMRKHQIEKIIRSKLNKKPDLKYYINNDYIEELVSLLIEGISEAIEENNRKVIDDISKDIRKSLR